MYQASLIYCAAYSHSHYKQELSYRKQISYMQVTMQAQQYTVQLLIQLL